MSSAVTSTAAAVAACTHKVTTSRNVHRLQGRGPGQRRLSAPRRLPPPRSGLFGGLFGSGAGSSSSSSNTADEEQAFLEDEEGGKMVALDASSAGSLDGSSEEAFGPMAVLAVGFTQQEFERLRRVLHEDMDAGMVKVIPAPTAAMAGSLGAALEMEPVPEFEQAPLGTRRVCFLSGMYAAEVMETIAAFREAGLPETVFAGAVPNNYDRSLQELVQEVFADHQAMKQRRQQQAAQQQAVQQQQQ
ncbi:hypothetical protein ABPG77_005618 [Micractinium sp. CCAP 211/92]